MINWSKFLKLRNKGRHFVILNILSIIIFGFLYFISDYIIKNFPNISQSFNLGTVKKVYRWDEYIHFSLTTQTTVGYGSIGSGIEHDRRTNINKNENTIFEILNYCQLFSIIYIFGMAFQN